VSSSRGEKGATAGARASRGAAAGGKDRAALLPDLFRRALALGLSGIFTTEEAFRRALGDTLPRDWVDFALDQSERTRNEFVNRLAGELARVVEAMDLEEMARRLLAENRVELKIEMRLVPDETPREGRARRSVSVLGGGRTK
jgi:hypothetical protein